MGDLSWRATSQWAAYPRLAVYETAGRQATFLPIHPTSNPSVAGFDRGAEPPDPLGFPLKCGGPCSFLSDVGRWPPD